MNNCKLIFEDKELKNLLKKIYIASPWGSNGASWLINCFLELGIKTYRSPVERMWTKIDDRFTLNPHEERLKKWFPALSNRKEFTFRKDIEVEWTHEWPNNKFKSNQIIYFIRDPRDSLYSTYKRENLNISFREYIYGINSHTLLDRIDTWCLYNRCWLAHNNLKFFKFEDYKCNANVLLREILKYIGINVDSNLIDYAVENSTFEKAKEVENKYRQLYPEDIEIVNRKGKVGGWIEEVVEQEIIFEIESRAKDLLDKFEYKSYFDKEEIKNSFILNKTKEYNSDVNKEYSIFDVIKMKEKSCELDFGFYDFSNEIEGERFKVLDKKSQMQLNNMKKNHNNYENIYEFTKKRQISTEIFNILKANKDINILIFGASEGGKLTNSIIKTINCNIKFNINIKAFIDNDEKKWGKEFCERTIVSPNRKIIGESDFVVVASNWKNVIVEQLLDMGIDKNKIVIAY